MLYSLARSWAWQAVVVRCQTHPEGATDAHCERGDNVLHWCAFGRAPVHAMQHLLQANINFAQHLNRHGLLPIHVACSYRASIHVLRVLLDVYPESAGCC
jgi:hypothetical protein